MRRGLLQRLGFCFGGTAIVVDRGPLHRFPCGGGDSQPFMLAGSDVIDFIREIGFP